MKMKTNTIPFTTSAGEIISIPEIDLQTTHDIYFWRSTAARGMNEEERMKWTKNLLQVIYPTLTPYDREMAFMTSWAYSMGSSRIRLSTTCPVCGESCSYVSSINGDRDRQYRIVIPKTGELQYTVNYRTPSEVAGNDGGPDTVSIEGYEFYEVDEFDAETFPELGDDCLLRGQRVKYNPFYGDIPVWKKINVSLPIRELPDDVRQEIMNYLTTYNSTSFTDFSAKPIEVTTRIRCSCGYDHTGKIHRVHDFLQYCLAENAVASAQADYGTIANLSHAGYMSGINDVLSLSPRVFNAYTATVKTLTKDKKK